VGKKHVAFGRTNLTHSHSWPYVNQPFVLRNLVAEESLLGEGIGTSYLLPTQGDLFAQLDLGTWAASEGHAHEHEEGDEDAVHGTGAGFNEHFNTAVSGPATRSAFGELEIGGSFCDGPAEMAAVPGEGRARLTGLTQLPHHGEGESRLLLRGVRCSGEESDLGDSTARATTFRELPQGQVQQPRPALRLVGVPGCARSPRVRTLLILTKQFSDSTTSGCKPWRAARSGPLQRAVAGVGVGPHTHSLE
jgi:hypothetical protein